MPPVSKVARLEKKKLAKVDKVLADNTKTLRQKHQHLQSEGVDVSLSGLHRYSKKMLELGKEVAQMNNIARTIAEQNKTGGEVVVSKTIITFLQTAVLKKLLNIDHLDELEEQELTRYAGIVTKLSNALVDLNKLPNTMQMDEVEDTISKLVDEHIKSLKPVATEDSKKKVSKNAKPRKDQ